MLFCIYGLCVIDFFLNYDCSFSDLEVLRSFQNQIASIQRDAVWWLHTVVPTISKVGAKDYVHWSVNISSEKLCIELLLCFPFDHLFYLLPVFTKCFSLNSLKHITSGTTGLLRVTESECLSLYLKITHFPLEFTKSIFHFLVSSFVFALRYHCWRTL